MYPKKAAFAFYRDAFLSIGALTIICIGFVIWSAIRFAGANATGLVVFVRTADLFTVLIPPALPIAITAGTTFAVTRLRMADIFCVVPKAVAVAGRVNLCAWDKTGTLTEDHM